MIADSEYIFFIAYGVLCVVVCLALIKVQSTETLTITTTEFKIFQTNFLLGYMTVILGEVLCVASFFYVLTSLDLTLGQITKLFIVSATSSTLFGVLSEIVDIGSRRDKCILSAILYAIATFSLFSGGHFEILMLGRVVYGGGNVLLHSAFDAYMVHEHTTQGFPDDWLLHTFGRLAHSMTIVAIIAGILGQASSALFGPFGCVGLSCLLFIGIALFIGVKWNKDVSSSRFMLSGFTYSLGQMARAMRSNTQVVLVVGLSTCAEAAILVFSFYWAPWIAGTFTSSALASAAPVSVLVDTSAGTSTEPVSGSGVAAGADGSTAEELAGAETTHLMAAASTVPFILIYSTLMMSAMLGNYLYTLANPRYGNDIIFQALLATAAGAFFISAIVQTPELVFLASICVQVCSGGYWPSIGYLRGRYFLPEIRGVTVALIRCVDNI